MIERLPVNIPLAIDAVWRARFWTTTPPIYVPHTEWTLSVTVDSEVPLRLAQVDYFPEKSVVSKYHRRPSSGRLAGEAYAVRTIRPTETEPIEAFLDSPWGALNVEPPANPVSWNLIPILKDSSGSVRRSIIAFPRKDTDGLRTGHWRIRQSLRRYLPVQSEAFNRGIYVAPVLQQWQQNGNS